MKAQKTVSLQVDEDMSFEVALRVARAIRSWRQKDAAAELGMNDKTYVRMERGERRPWPHELEKFAAVFGQNIEFFVLAVHPEPVRTRPVRAEALAS